MKLLASLSAAVFVALIVVTSAFAHAEPGKVTPGDGAVLNQPPAEIVIEMTQEMYNSAGANDIEVFDAAGSKVTKTSAVIDNANRSRLTVGLPSALPVGVYTVKWKTLSADDGDPANGTLSFTYDPAKPANPGKVNIADTNGVPVAGATSGGDAPPAAALSTGGSSDGTSWVLVAAVAVGMFVAGGGVTFLLVQKKT